MFLGKPLSLLTVWIALFCAFVFVVNGIESYRHIGLTSIQKAMLFEFPPSWQKFSSIRHGELWRLFSPAFLHKDLFHLLFNMGWLLLLGVQIEQRIGKLRLLVLIAVVSLCSNVAQYLVTGPYFLGFSAVVMGMVGFIWVRQKIAPAEAYPLSKAAILFVFYSSIGMLVYSVLFSSSIANTAHVVGGTAGVVLGCIPFFARR